MVTRPYWGSGNCLRWEAMQAWRFHQSVGEARRGCGPTRGIHFLGIGRGSCASRRDLCLKSQFGTLIRVCGRVLIRGSDEACCWRNCTAAVLHISRDASEEVVICSKDDGCGLHMYLWYEKSCEGVQSSPQTLPQGPGTLALKACPGPWLPPQHSQQPWLQACTDVGG